MRIIIILILLALTIQLSAISYFACLYTLNNPSARGVAFGNDSGAADIWDTSPLGVWSNPAKLGYHNGIAYGYTYTSWFAEVFPDIYSQSSYVSIGWKGVGILLPAPSMHERSGTVWTYGEQTQTDTLGNVIGTFESWDEDKKIAVGINTIEFTANILWNDFLKEINNYGELSLGYSYDDIYSNLASSSSGSSSQNLNFIGESNFSSYGLIGRISPFNQLNALGGFCTLDIVGGINFINPDKEKITYMNESQADDLPWGTHSAFSGKLSITPDVVPGLSLPPILDDFVDNLFTYYYSQDNTAYGKKSDDNPSEWGYGYEFTFFDIISIRNGEYRDWEGGLLGYTYGFGVNLNYKDIFQFQYNYAEIPGGELERKHKTDDYLFRVDFLELFGKKGE